MPPAEGFMHPALEVVQQTSQEEVPPFMVDQNSQTQKDSGFGGNFFFIEIAPLPDIDYIYKHP